MADTAKDFLAVIDVMGVGSWARGPDREKAIKDVVRLFKRDFKTYFKLPKGKVVAINVVAITGTGNGNVHWDACGFHTEDKETIIAVETVKYTL